MECKIQVNSNAFFAENQIGMSVSGTGFQYSVSLAGATATAHEIKSELVTLQPQQTTGPSGACIAYCAEFDPLIIDLNQDGIHLGPSGEGVWFDMQNSGQAQHMQWVAANGNEAFLIYDLNGNGIVDNGSELFGNGTFMRAITASQNKNNIKSTIKAALTNAANGFVALAQFDSATLGGNDDGVISSDDAVWSKLSLWLDSNADGQSTPDEILTLQQANLTQLDTIPRSNQRQDSAGNWLPLWAWGHNPQTQGANKHKMVNVFFKAL